MRVPYAAGHRGRWGVATAALDGDPGHLVPDEVWAQVVAAAQLRADELLAAYPDVPGLFGLPDRTITARSHGGVMVGGPRLGVIHSAETPLRAGYAFSIAANWFATKATTSATVMIDPAETIRLLPDNVVAYHVGPRANGFTVAVEQAGYARLSLAEWTTLAGLQQMDRVAQYMRECRDRWGIPLRWATDEQIRAAARGGPPVGWCFHDDVRLVLGGTTHTDPMPHYPGAMLMALANEGEDDMAGTEALELLRDIRAQLTGSGSPGQYPGLPDLADADGRPRTVVQALAALGPVPNAVADVRAQLTGSGSPGQYPGLPDLADADGRRRTVVQALAALLASGGDRGQLLTIVTSAVTEALGRDNDQLAQDIVARLGRALTA